MNYFEHLKLLKLGIVSNPEKPKKAIPKQSEKRKAEQVIYRKIVADKIKESAGLCLLKGPTCSGLAQGADHSQNRSPANFIDPDNILPACNNCNNLKVIAPGLFKSTVSRFK